MIVETDKLGETWIAFSPVEGAIEAVRLRDVCNVTRIANVWTFRTNAGLTYETSQADAEFLLTELFDRRGSSPLVGFMMEDTK